MLVVYPACTYISACFGRLFPDAASPLERHHLSWLCIHASWASGTWKCVSYREAFLNTSTHPGCLSTVLGCYCAPVRSRSRFQLFPLFFVELHVVGSSSTFVRQTPSRSYRHRAWILHTTGYPLLQQDLCIQELVRHYYLKPAVLSAALRTQSRSTLTPDFDGIILTNGQLDVTLCIRHDEGSLVHIQS